MKTEGYVSVNHWEKFQHYKNRTPPWLKLHRDLLNNYEFRDLPDASKAHLVLIWLLASQLDNVIPADPEWIRERINCNDKVDLNILIKKKFLIATDVHASIEAETEVKAEVEILKPPPKKKRAPGRPKETQKLFYKFYEVYPVRKSAKRAKAVWERDKLDDKFDMIVADVKHRLLNDRQWIEGYIPHPSTYLNQELWTDEISPTSSSRPSNGVGRQDPGSRHQSAIERKRGSSPEARTIDGVVLGKDDRGIRDSVGK